MIKTYTKLLWRVAEIAREESGNLAQALGVSRLVAHLLMLRNAKTVDDAERFLAPSEQYLSDPFSLTDMQAAVDRIKSAVKHNEQVVVFGDYDVDGISGTALLVRALRRIGLENCTYSMPSRLIDGYGLNVDCVRGLHEQGAELIITVDNGISSHEAAIEAKSLGIDMIITDHHSIGKTLPEAVAVINPKREPESHPAHFLSGSAVAHKLAVALTGSLDDLQIAALGIVADIVPLQNENRLMAAIGLREMADKPLIGLSSLAKVSGININEATSGHIAYQLAPRINAGGRLGDGMLGLELLLTNSEADAANIAKELDQINDERRSVEKEIFDDAVEEVENTCRDEQRSILLSRSGWHPGVIGIVASRLLSRYARPVVLIAIDENGVGRGSARSDTSFQLVEALGECEDLLEKFGGHAAAAGLTCSAENADSLKDAFEAEAVRRMPEGLIQRELNVDAQVSLSAIDSQFVAELEKLQPFGHGNREPVFCTYGVDIMPDSVRELRGGHLKFSVKQGPKVLTAIGFNMAERWFAERNSHGHPDFENCKAAGTVADIAFTPKFNTWRGETTVQLVLKDYVTSS